MGIQESRFKPAEDSVFSENVSPIIVKRIEECISKGIFKITITPHEFTCFSREHDYPSFPCFQTFLGKQYEVTVDEGNMEVTMVLVPLC